MIWQFSVEKPTRLLLLLITHRLTAWISNKISDKQKSARLLGVVWFRQIKWPIVSTLMSITLCVWSSPSRNLLDHSDILAFHHSSFESDSHFAIDCHPPFPPQPCSASRFSYNKILLLPLLSAFTFSFFFTHFNIIFSFKTKLRGIKKK